MKYLLLLVFVFSCGRATPQAAHGKFDGLDTFGSHRLSESVLKLKYGSKLEELSGIPETAGEKHFGLKREIENALKADFGFVFAAISVITYFPPKAGRFATVDVVEAEDARTRMPFLASPSGKYPDPDGVIALWQEYEEAAWTLMRSGELQGSHRCPVWHCSLGFDHPRLAPYLAQFNALVPRNRIVLEKILRDDAHVNHRAFAAFLLAHGKDGKAIVDAVAPAIFDSSELVRNNAIRVLALIAHDHPSIPIRVQPIIAALKFPTATDRNKAGSALAALSAKEENKKEILEGAGWIFFEMLKLKQPNNREPAYSALKNLSGLDFGESDFEGWEAWLRSKIGPRARSAW